jgi:hypothetical protein
MLFRSMPSSRPSSMIWRMISSSISCESSSEALRRDLKLDWCSTTRGGIASLDVGVAAALLLVERPSSLLLLVSALWFLSPRLLSLLLLSRGSSKVFDAETGSSPTSCRLICCTLSKTLLSSSSCSSPPLRRSFGKTLSPYLNFSLSDFLSCSLLPRCGFAWTKMSKSVVTVAFGRVERTEARHEGQVYG